MSKQVLKMTTVNVSKEARALLGEDGVNELELHFTELQRIAKEETVAQRAAARAAAKAKIAEGARALAAVDLLQHAAQFSEIIAVEHNWMMPYRDSNGDICLDNPLTARDVRAAARVHHKQLADHVDPDDLNLYSGEEE